MSCRRMRDQCQLSLEFRFAPTQALHAFTRYAGLDRCVRVSFDASLSEISY